MANRITNTAQDARSRLNSFYESVSCNRDRNNQFISAYSTGNVGNQFGQIAEDTAPSIARALDTRYIEWPGFSFLPGGTANVLGDTLHRVAYLTINTANSNIGAAETVASKVLQSLYNTSVDYFFRPQSITITQKPITQVKQTFDGIFAGTYGGGLGSIKIDGVTKLWSYRNSNQSDTPINVEAEVIERLMMVLANARGLIFNFHDGFQARKWPCILQSYSSVKSVAHQNQQVYSISLLIGSFAQKFRHVNRAGSSTTDLGIFPIGGYPARRVI